MTDIDPIQLEVLRNALVAASEEMSVTIWRTSRSTVVREMLDYSTAVFDAQGRNVAQATRIPVHLNSMATCLDGLLRHRTPISEWRDGDVLITNDPYCGGQHLPDILAYRPVFVDGEPVAIVGALCHHIDVGGGAPGSYDALATEIFQEGLRIPPVRIYASGKRNQAVFDMILQNSREPEKVGGDLASQVAALEVGAAEVARIARRYGTAALRAAGDAILDQSEQAMRAALRAMPDGVYEFEDWVDDDGITDESLRIHVSLSIREDRVMVDFTGSSPQAAGSVNCTLNMTKSAVYFAVMSAAGGHFAANSGCYRPIEVIAPRGTGVTCRHPAPVANRMATGHRVVNTVMGALGQVLPDRIPAAYYGVSYVYSLGAEREDGERDVYLEIEVGGWGAHPDGDGASAFSAGFHNLANSPLEMIESAYPVTFTAYGLTPDSGGAGKTRGGLGLHREWRLDAPRGVLSTSFERFRHAPYGLGGGSDGPVGHLYVRRNGQVEEPGAKVTGLVLQGGDSVRLETSGGGGFGDPKARPAEAVERDIRDGYVTPAAAESVYGYQVRDGKCRPGPQ